MFFKACLWRMHLLWSKRLYLEFKLKRIYLMFYPLLFSVTSSVNLLSGSYGKQWEQIKQLLLHLWRQFGSTERDTSMAAFRTWRLQWILTLNESDAAAKVQLSKNSCKSRQLKNCESIVWAIVVPTLAVGTGRIGMVNSNLTRRE